MSAKKSLANLRTWIEIDRRALARNINFFRTIVGPKVKLWSVVKSNAYGHGLMVFAKLADELGVDGFCVDSCVEGLRLREEGIKKPILVLGATLKSLVKEAAREDLTLTVSNFEMLDLLSREKIIPKFHIKIDTGMHRQGFYLEDVPRLISKIKNPKTKLADSFAGIYTHFASAKDVNYPTYTDHQFEKFEKARKLFARAGFSQIMAHAANTGATLVNKKYHCDAVRVGIGLYGLWPSKELEIQLPKLKLSPVLSWRTVIAEVKSLKLGDYVGYDLAERVTRPTKSAVLPIGYWHGFPRSFSGSGEVLIKGKRARVLGRVSMDMTVVDISGIGSKVGDHVTLIGRDNGKEITAFESAARAQTIHYEFLTRLNPLMERVIV